MFQSAQRDCGHEAGFTLVEVLAASAVLSVLGLCLVRLWAAGDATTFYLLERQKAVLVLNGEMERLATLYEITPFGGGTITQTSGYPAFTYIPSSGTRLTYATNSVGAGSTPIPFAVTSAAAFSSGPDTNVWIAGGMPAQNFVWVDHSRNLMGRMSWVSCAVSSNGQTTNICWSSPTAGKLPPSVPSTCMQFSAPVAGKTTPCLLITLVLDYPYSLVSGAAVPAGNLTTLTLSTIVGRRA